MSVVLQMYVIAACISAVPVGNLSPIQLDVPLTTDEPAGVGRQGEPCSTGVPFPPGLLQEPEGIVVVDPGGKAVPAQFRVLERWREKAFGKDDLSIKWLLIRSSRLGSPAVCDRW